MKVIRFIVWKGENWFVSDLYKLIKRLGIQRKYFFLLMLRAPFDAFRTWMLAGLMKTTFLCLETGDTKKLSMTCVCYGLICTALFFYNGTIWSIYAAFAAKAEAKLQKLMIEKILGLPFRRIDSCMDGEWMTKLNSDIQAAFTIMNAPGNIVHVVVSVINTLLSSVLLFRSSFPLFMVTGLCILPHLFMNYKVVLRHMSKLKEASQQAMTECTSAIRPLITEADAILIYDAGDMLMRKCEESSRKLMKMNMCIHTRNVLSNVMIQLFGKIGYIIMLVMGYGIIYNGVMSFSDLLYCFQVRVSFLSGTFMAINCWNNVKCNAVCLKRVNDTFDE